MIFADLSGVRQNIPLAPYTTFGVGGTAEFFVEVTASEDLIAAVRLARLNHLPYRIIAGGSNLVCKDGILPGLTIRILSGSVELLSETVLRVDAGVVLMDVVNFAIDHDLSGLETLSGIPGSLGGAVVGNAGAYGRTIGESVERVEIFDGTEVRWISNAACEFRYRDSVFKHAGAEWIVLRVELTLRRGEGEVLRKRSNEIIQTRLKKYAPGLKCPGSFFKNVLLDSLSDEVHSKIDLSKVIEGKVPTGYLLEAVGACGKKTEHLTVASFHGNLIINEGGATFDEVKEFSAFLKGLVKQRFGIELEEEVRYLS